MFPPYNLHDFKELIWQNYLYVDKSLLIKKFLNISESSENKTIVINQPIGWGKSLNLDMLRRFFEIEVDENGVELSEEQKIFKKFFVGGEVKIGDEKKTLHKLYIAKYMDIVEKYQGKFPVISFSFKNVFNLNVDTMRTSIAERLMDLYSKQYPYLKKYCSPEDNTIADLNKADALSYFNREISPDSVMDNALYMLSHLLEEHFKQKVIVLIDDYDEPIQYAIQKFDNQTENYNRTFETVANLLGAVLKNNPHVEHSLMVGVFPFNEFNYTLDTLYHYLITDHVFTKYFALVEREVDQLLAAVQTQTKLSDIKPWYRVYYDFISYFNPVSILQCLKNKGKLQRYFMQKDRLDFLEGETIFNEVHEIPLQRLFLNATTRLYYYSPLRPQYEIVMGRHSKDVFHFFLFAGYLSFEESGYPPGYLYMSVPNYEAMYAYQRLQCRMTRYKLGLAKGWHMTPGLLLGSYKMKDFEMELQKVLNTTNALDRVNITKVAEDQLFYNGILLSIASSLPPDFILVMGMEVEFIGKVEMLFVPSKTSKNKDCIVLHHTVVTETNSTLHELAEMGAKCINLTSYENKLKQFPYVKHIHKVFIAFQKNQLVVEDFRVLNYRGEDVVTS